MNSPTSKVNDLEDLLKQSRLDSPSEDPYEDAFWDCSDAEVLFNDIANMIFDRFDDISKIIREEEMTQQIDINTLKGSGEITARCAAKALAFMHRAKLDGGEVDDFNEASTALSAIVTAAIKTADREQLDLELAQQTSARRPAEELDPKKEE